MAQFLDLTGLARYKNKSDALYAKQDGSYEGMTVEYAEQLVSTVGVEESAPYTFRTTGGSADVGDRMNLKAVVGGTVAWNQLVQNGDFANVSTWYTEGCSYTVSDNVATITKSVANPSTIVMTIPSSIREHVLLLCADIKGANTYVGVVTSGYGSVFNSVSAYPTNADSFTRCYALGKPTSAGIYYVIRSATSGGGEGTKFYAKNAQYFDLTAMLGSTIADYIYAIEQANAGAGVAWLKKYGWFTKPYYPYKAASLESVKTSAHKTYGFNAYNPSTEKAKVVGGNLYQITGAYTALSLDGTSITPDANGYFTPSANGELTVTGGNSTTTCVHLKWDGERDGEWEEFSEHTYALDDVELRGVPKKDANNNLYYDGDRYLPDGTVERRYKKVAIGSVDWTAYDGFFYTNFTDRAANQNVIAEGYTNIGAQSDANMTNAADLTIAPMSNANGTIKIKNSAYTTNAQFKAAMANVYMVYELATPTTEAASPYQQTQIVDDFGTEEFVDAAVEANERDVAIPVGHETFYQNNLKAKLEMAPNSPDGDGVYVVQQTNGENEYIPLVIPVELPTFPSDDGTYVLKITVSDGTVTKAWVEEV